MLGQICFKKYDHIHAHIIFTDNLRLFTAQGKQIDVIWDIPCFW